MNVSDLLSDPHEEHMTAELKLNMRNKSMHLMDDDDIENQNSQSNATRRLGIRFLLCDTGDNLQEGPRTIQRPAQPKKRPAEKTKRSTAATPTTMLSVIPDKDRKRPYRLSSKQRQRRLDNEALESRTYNLTLDVNNLKQQVRYLQERRDLYITRLAIARQHAAGEAVGMVARLFRLFCDETCGTNERQTDDRYLFLSRVHGRLTSATAGGRDGVPYFMQTWRNFKLLFTHRSYTVKSIRLVSHVGALDLTETEDHRAAICTSEAQQRCGPSGGCVVESEGEFTGRLKRDAIAAISPSLLRNEVLVSHLIGQKLSCSLRMMAYFDAKGQLVDHVADFDVIRALDAVIEDCSQCC